MTTELGLPLGSGYGTSRYAGSYKAESSGISKRHYYALKKIFPLKYLEGELDNDLEIEGYWLDSCEESAWQLLEEFFANTTNRLISTWESLYSIDTDDTATLDERRDTVVAARRATGGLTIEYFEDIADGLGYSISISEGIGNLFKVGFSIPPATPIPAKLYDISERYTWTVTVSGVSSADDLETLFIKLAPAHTKVSFVYSP